MGVSRSGLLGLSATFGRWLGRSAVEPAAPAALPAGAPAGATERPVPLCGRGALGRRLAAIAASTPPQTPAALFVCGVDGMREFSRGYGFDAGDALMRAVSDRLAAALPADAMPATAMPAAARPADVMLARLDGFSFACALIGFTPEQTLALAHGVVTEIGSTSFDIGFGPVSATVSVGARCAPAAALADPEVLDAALGALDDARAGEPEAGADGGGVCVLEAGAGGVGATPSQMRTAARSVMQALAGDGIGVAYQPVVSAAPPHGLAFRECLARLRDGGEWVSAGQFMHKIERLDLVSALDRRILRSALATLRAHPTERLSVNVSARTTADRLWLRELREAAEADPSSAERLIVELTESSAVSDPARTVRFLDEVRKLGCAIALDDFGAGYSSFRHVRDFRPDWVKIDGGFVRGVATDPDNMLFVDTLVGIARNFDMATVAEFVETAADAETLLALGVDCLQGYRFGAPEMAPAWKDTGPAAATG